MINHIKLFFKRIKISFLLIAGIGSISWIDKFNVWINLHLKYIIAIVSVGIFLDIFLYLLDISRNKKIVGREKIVSQGKKMILAAKKNVIMFGKDISWVPDYIDSILKAIENGAEVVVYCVRLHPKKRNVTRDRPEMHSKVNRDESISTKMKENIELLKKNGVKVIVMNYDFGLRATLIDDMDEPQLLLFNRKKKGSNYQVMKEGEKGNNDSHDYNAYVLKDSNSYDRIIINKYVKFHSNSLKAKIGEIYEISNN